VKHDQTVQTIMYIFKALKLKSVPYLSSVLPSIFKLIDTTEELFKEFLFQQMSLIVKIVNKHIRDYLTNLMELILKAWEMNETIRASIVILIEELCVALGDEFNVYLPFLIPKLVHSLNNNKGLKNKTCS